MVCLLMWELLTYVQFHTSIWLVQHFLIILARKLVRPFRLFYSPFQTGYTKLIFVTFILICPVLFSFFFLWAILYLGIHCSVFCTIVVSFLYNVFCWAMDMYNLTSPGLLIMSLNAPRRMLLHWHILAAIGEHQENPSSISSCNPGALLEIP